MGQLKRLPFIYCRRSERLICNKNLFILLIGLIILVHPVFSEFTTIHSFNGGTNDGSSPHGSLILSGSTLYGMTYEGGNGVGTIFKVQTDGSEFTLLHKFSGGIDGQNPFGSLILSGSTLYGMTYGAMPSEYGTIFKIQTDGSGYSILHEFAGGASDGANPRGSLLLSGSTLYGATFYGGTNNDGTIFKIETDGADFTLLHDFSILSYDGKNPRGSLIISGSTLYGTTFSGANGGTIFKIETDGSNYSILFTLASSTLPGDLILIGSNLYGMMLGSASSTEGMIFKVQTDGTGYTGLHNFSGGPSDGAKPFGSLCLSNSTLFGMTSAGGDANLGTIFKIETDGSSYAVLREFSESGANRPEGSLIISGSTLYGMTPTSGYVGLGTIFSFTPPGVRVTSPNGGESWIANSMHDIIWTSFEVNDVDIDYSTDGGSTWASVADNITNNGVYSWTIPNSPSSACLVRVQEYDAIPTDKSDSLFSINTISITGTILVNASPLSGVVLSGLPGDPVTDSSGHYNASVSYNWSGTVLPTLAGYSFSPTNRNYTNVVIDQTAQDYAAALITHTISGTVLVGGSPLAGVVMSGLPGDPITDASGVYSGTVTYGWAGTVTPTLAGYTFSPAFREYSGVASDQTAQDYTAARITFPISGTITAYGYGLAGVTMGGLPGTITTDSSGAYSGTVDYGWSGTVTPSKTGYSFTPATRDYASVTSSQTSQDYTALCTMAIPQIEREALIALYTSTNGDSWTENTGWKTPPLHSDGFALPGTEYAWSGVTCNSEHTAVTNVKFTSNNNLSGTLPAEIGNLSYLIAFEIRYNSKLIGNIPPEIGNLNNLQSLRLDYTQLTGQIPAELGALLNLTTLTIVGNTLTGSIPVEFGNLSSLQGLSLINDGLSGIIPIELGNLTNLQSLSLQANQLTGTIPTELGNLTGLTYLSLASNQLTGIIPVEFGNLINLQTLQLSSNQLSGGIPSQLGNLVNLQTLELGPNPLGGIIPAEFGNLTSLVNLYLDSNQLSGTIPVEIGNLANLKRIYLRANNLSGNIPSELGNLSSLEYLFLSSNYLTGPIPASLGNLLELRGLTLNSNNLGGSIPTSLVNLTKLQQINANFAYNALYTDDAGLIAFLNSKNPGWDTRQTIAPINIAATPVSSTSINLTWDAILYTSDTGGYRISIGTASGGPYTFFQQTANKSTTSMPVTGLNPATTYYFVISTRTDPHEDLTQYGGGGQRNTIDSEDSSEATATTIPVHTVQFIAGSGGVLSGITTQIIDHGSSTTPVTAVPNAGYHFIGWIGEYSGTENPLTITNVTDDLIIFADFDINQYIVTFIEGAGGTIIGTKVQTVTHGGSTTAVQAVPETNHHFVNWTGGATSTTNPLTVINVTSDLTIHANFAIDQHTVTFVEGSGGTITGIKVQTIDHGSSTTPVEALPGTGYDFVNWTGDFTGTDNPLTITNVTANKTITANFTIRTYTISGQVAFGGAPLANVVMNGLPCNPTSDASGGYSGTVTYDWSGTVIPTLAGHTFTPISRDYANVTADHSAQDYTAVLNNYTISGNITWNGSPLEGVTMSGLPGSPISDSSGHYSAGIQHGWSGTVTPTRQYFTFSPDSTTYTDVASSQVTDYTASIGQPLLVTAPAAEAMWERGKTYAIRWLKQGAQNASVKIQLYKGTSTLVKTITSTTANDGEYSWLVPTTLATGTTYFIKVKTVDNLVYDDSDPFAIIVPGMTITAPTTGTIWVKNAVKTIAWTKKGTLDANVKIQLFKGLTKKLDILLSAPNNGSYDWLVPAGLDNATNYTIKVITLDNKVTAKSGKFTIAAGVIRVTSPTAGAKLIRGTQKEITWTSEGTVNANVKIDLYKGTTKVLTIAPSVPTADGAFTWTVPAAQALATTYTVKITALDNLISGKTGSFSIVAGIITITAPAAGTVWQRGLPHIITWTKEGTLNANVKIQLYKGTTLASTLASTTPNDESYEWTIPAGQALSSKYKIRVATVDGLVKADSGTFTISDSAGLALTAPNGNEALQAGEPYAIRWTEDPNVLEVKLEFSRDNGGTYTDIADHVEDTGQYGWQVPVNFTKNGIVRVSDAGGRAWQEEGLIECTFRFLYNGIGDDAGMKLWFGASDVNAPSYGFGRIDIGDSSIGFGGLTRTVGPLAGSWHELRVRLDLRRDAAGIFLDDVALFENAALGTTRERYFEPGLALAAGGEQGLEMELDDLAISVVRQDELGEDRQAFTVLRDDFERYDAKANPIESCWQLPAMLDDGSSIELNLETAKNKSLRLRAEAGKRIHLRLPFALPDKVPFDISDKNVVIEN